MSARGARWRAGSAVAALLAVLGTGARADPVRLDLAFELKMLWGVFHDDGRMPLFPGTLSVPSEQARWMADVQKDWFAAEAHLVLSHATWNIDNGLFRLFGTNLVVTRVTETLPLQAELADVPGQDGGNRLEARLRFDRLWLRASTPFLDLTAGRQPLTFGTAVLYQTIDRIVPLPPSSIDREYKPGVDAVRADLHLGHASALSLVYAFGGDADAHDARVAAALRGPVGGGEGLLFASVLREMPLFGLGYEVDVGSWILRGEGSVAAVDNALGTAPAFGMATAGFEHLFGFGLDLVTEINYFGFGVDDPKDYPKVLYPPRILNGDLPFFFGTWFAGGIASYSFLSWLDANLLVSVSLIEGAVYLYPTITCSIPRAQLLLSGILPIADRGIHPYQPSSELDLSPPAFLTELRVFFGR